MAQKSDCPRGDPACGQAGEYRDHGGPRRGVPRRRDIIGNWWGLFGVHFPAHSKALALSVFRVAANVIVIRLYTF